MSAPKNAGWILSAAPIAAAVFLGCSSPAVVEPVRSPSTKTTSAPAKPTPTLALRADSAELAQNQELVLRMRSSVFAYYRYIDAPFTERVCDAWSQSNDAAPRVNLHGDAHLEQYAVADDGRGLADFDSASIGPPIVDLLRFSTSLWLAAHDRFPDLEADVAVTRFLEGYRAALIDPDALGPEPRAAARIRAGFTTTPAEWLDHVEKFMLPMSDEKRAKLGHSNESYVNAMLAQNPELTRSFFAIKRAGAIKMGIGSAHELKFLARVEGPTPIPDDDVILETKQVIGRTMGSCVHGGEWGDPSRIIVGQARLSASPQRFLGHLRARKQDLLCPRLARPLHRARCRRGRDRGRARRARLRGRASARARTSEAAHRRPEAPSGAPRVRGPRGAESSRGSQDALRRDPHGMEGISTIGL